MKQQVRIIGGLWRGRNIKFPDAEGLRPTPNRVRETLFNWLQPEIRRARCLDLFAGSGALGFEALSRGASHVTFVDQSRVICDTLKNNLALLNCNNADVINANASRAIAVPQEPFNIILLDPPFRQGLENTCLTWLQQPGYLHDNSLLYIETHFQDDPELPENWEITQSKRAGQVKYQLLRASL